MALTRCASDIAQVIDTEPDRARGEDYPHSVSAALHLSYKTLSDEAKWVADVLCLDGAGEGWNRGC